MITRNGNSWKKFKLVGIQSNKAAIGAVVRLKAVINENEVWQLREISAQNSFNSQNNLDAHFGLSDASTIDSVIINWPSGVKQVLTNLQINTIETVTEPPSTDIGDEKHAVKSFLSDQNYPNPFNPKTTIKYSIPQKSFVSIKVFNLIGELKKVLVQDYKDEGEHVIEFNAEGLSSGIYFYVFQAGEFIISKKMILLK